MIELSPAPEDRPMIAWLGDAAPCAPDASAQASAAVRLVEMGFGSVALSLPVNGAEGLSQVASFAAECAKAGLALWLRLPAPNLDNDTGLQCTVRDIGSAMSAEWQVPEELGPVISIVAAPLVGPQVTPLWEQGALLHKKSLRQQREILKELAKGAGARIWLWSEEGPDQPATGYLTGEKFWLDVLPAFLQLCSAAGMRSAIRGIYLDATPSAARGLNRFPWMPELPAKFALQHGYDLLEHLPSLVADSGPAAVRVRQHYWSSLTELYQETRWQPLQQRAGQLGLQLSGGFAFSSIAPQSTAFLIGVAQLTPFLDSPGLLSPLPREEDAGQYLPARLLASAAALSGGRYTYAQTWNSAAWSDTPQECLRHLHALMQAGVTRLQTQAACDSFTSEPTVLQQPFSEHLSVFNGYLARSFSLLSGGRPGARVALLWPGRSVQSHYNPRGHRIARWVQEDLVSTVTLLDELHFDFLFLEENELVDSEIENADSSGCVLRCGSARHAFEMVVLPSVSALTRQAWRKLETFVSAGGRVVCLGLLPRWSENGRDDEFENYIGKATRIVVADLYDAYAQAEGAPANGQEPSVIGYPVVRTWTSGGRLGCYQPRLNLDSDDARLRVRQMLSESLTPEMETQAPGVRLTRRIHESGELIYVLNKARETQRINLRLSPKRASSPYSCDANLGTASPMLEWMSLTALDGGGLAVPLTLAPGEARFVWLEYGARQPHAERSNFFIESFDGENLKGYAIESGVPLASVRSPANDRIERWSTEAVSLPPALLLTEGWEARPVRPNVLRLNEWQWHQGRALNPGAGGRKGQAWYALDSAQSAQIFKRVLSHSDEEQVTFRGSFTIEEAGLQLWLRVPTETTEVLLGTERLLPQASPFGAEPLWSGDALWFNLEAAAPGQNFVYLTTPLNAAGLRPLSCPLVIGEFSLTTEDSIVPAQALPLEYGAWQSQGFPFFCGQMELRRQETIPADWENCRVFLELSSMRDSVEVAVNGISLGVQVAIPYRFDVTAALEPGAENEIALRIWSTADAVLGDAWSQPAPAGLLGPARLVAYPFVHIEKPK